MHLKSTLSLLLAFVVMSECIPKPNQREAKFKDNSDRRRQRLEKQDRKLLTEDEEDLQMNDDGDTSSCAHGKDARIENVFGLESRQVQDAILTNQLTLAHSLELLSGLVTRMRVVGQQNVDKHNDLKVTQDSALNPPPEPEAPPAPPQTVINLPSFRPSGGGPSPGVAFTDLGISFGSGGAQADDHEGAGVSELRYQCLYPYTGVLDECFWISDFDLDWYSAKKHCEGMHGDLAVPRYLYALKAHLINTGHNDTFLLGGRDRREEGYWLWMDGSEVDAADFQDYQPDDAGGAEDCLAMEARMHPPLADVNCDTPFKFICQYI